MFDSFKIGYMVKVILDTIDLAEITGLIIGMNYAPDFGGYQVELLETSGKVTKFYTYVVMSVEVIDGTSGR